MMCESVFLVNEYDLKICIYQIFFVSLHAKCVQNKTQWGKFGE